MKRRLRTLTALAAIAVLTAGCNPFGVSSRERFPEDPRFAEFTYKTDGTIEVQERTDSFNERMPGLGASEGHVVAANFPEGWLLPSPDHHYWLTGVATVPHQTIPPPMARPPKGRGAFSLSRCEEKAGFRASGSRTSPFTGRTNVKVAVRNRGNHRKLQIAFVEVENFPLLPQRASGKTKREPPHGRTFVQNHPPIAYH